MKNKGILHTYAKEIFYDLRFQEEWKQYQESYGEDIDSLFGEDYSAKVRFREVFARMLNGELGVALSKLKGFASSCVTASDKQIYDRLLRICLNTEAMQKVKVGDWVKDDVWGYWQVVDRTPQYAMIKNGFNKEMKFRKDLLSENDFGILCSDLQAYQTVSPDEQDSIETFFETFPEKFCEFTKQTNTYRSYKRLLLQSGMQEATEKQGRFYRYTAEKVAFVLNLKDLGDGIQVTYGFTSVADDAFLNHHGEDDSDIKLRFSAVITSEKDEEAVADAIKKIFDTYLGRSKDDILALKKERQKEFLQKIADKLKPLGFKKKGAKWTKALTGDFCLEFEAQKSQWSDEYYFNINVYHAKIQYPQCYSMRLRTDGKEIYNWQLLSDEEINRLIDSAIKNILLPMINTPLAELGAKKEIWLGCTCHKEKCQNCWVEKNLWEAKENESRMDMLPSADSKSRTKEIFNP